MKKLLLYAVLAIAPTLSAAQTDTRPIASTYRDRDGNTQGAVGMFCVPAKDGSGCSSGSGGASVPTRASSTTAYGTITTAGTYQSALASSTTRLGCALQNTSAGTMRVYVGPPGSATDAAAFQINPGGSFGCASGTVVLTDQISVASATAGAPFVVVSQ